VSEFTPGERMGNEPQISTDYTQIIELETAPGGYLEEVLTKAIIGAAMQVHRKLGRGFLEKVYEKALRKELELRGLVAVCQASVAVSYILNFGTKSRQFKRLAF